MLLYILRHAWAEEPSDQDWPDDRLRPLTDEGKHRFRQVAKTLVERDCRPELIASSPLVRCRQTAELLANALEGKPEVLQLEALAPGSDLRELIGWSAQQRVESLAWVGHAPDVSHLAAELLGSSRARLRFTKGAACAIQFPGRIQRGAGTLVWHVTAKILGC